MVDMCFCSGYLLGFIIYVIELTIGLNLITNTKPNGLMGVDIIY